MTKEDRLLVARAIRAQDEVFRLAFRVTALKHFFKKPRHVVRQAERDCLNARIHEAGLLGRIYGHVKPVG